MKKPVPEDELAFGRSHDHELSPTPKAIGQHPLTVSDVGAHEVLIGCIANIPLHKWLRKLP